MDKDYNWTKNLYKERPKTVHACHWRLNNQEEMIEFLQQRHASYSLTTECSKEQVERISLYVLETGKNLIDRTFVNHGDVVVYNRDEGTWSIMDAKSFREKWIDYNEV